MRPVSTTGERRSGHRRDVDVDQLHGEAALRLAALDQRYTASRRKLVTSLLDAGRPVTITEILDGERGVPMSSAYRNLTVLCEAGVARRLVGSDDLGRFELDEDLSGHHHHHMACSNCGTVADVRASARLEQALAEAARLAAKETGFQVSDHRIELVGRCPSCQ
ncbi:MAG: Fur family transcriptional regulator [Acidimicrobiales bacterium]